MYTRGKVDRTGETLRRYQEEVWTGEERRCPATNCRQPWHRRRDGSGFRDHLPNCDFLAWQDEEDAAYEAAFPA